MAPTTITKLPKMILILRPQRSPTDGTIGITRIPPKAYDAIIKPSLALLGLLKKASQLWTVCMPFIMAESNPDVHSTPIHTGTMSAYNARRFGLLYHGTRSFSTSRVRTGSEAKTSVKLTIVESRALVIKICTRFKFGGKRDDQSKCQYIYIYIFLANLTPLPYFDNFLGNFRVALSYENYKLYQEVIRPREAASNGAIHSRNECNPRWQALPEVLLSRLRLDIFPNIANSLSFARDDIRIVY